MSKNMLREDYVSFETAKLLKGAGFNESVTHYYFTQVTRVGFSDYPVGIIYMDSDGPCLQNNYKNKVAAPTLQMAKKWLKEKFKLHIFVSIYTTSYSQGIGYKTLYMFNIQEVDNWGVKIDSNTDLDRIFSCPWIAEEEAIRYCLENLI